MLNLVKICLIIYLTWITKGVGARNKSLLKRIFPHLMCSFHPSISWTSHYNIRVRIPIIKSILSFFIVGILKHIHRINFRRHIISNCSLFICMKIQKICFIWYKRWVFWLSHDRLSKGIFNFMLAVLLLLQDLLHRLLVYILFLKIFLLKIFFI